MRHINPYFLLLGTAGVLLLGAGVCLCVFSAGHGLLCGALAGAAGLVCLVLLLAVHRKWCRPGAMRR